MVLRREQRVAPYQPCTQQRLIARVGEGSARPEQSALDHKERARRRDATLNELHALFSDHAQGLGGSRDACFAP
jgi:hypothetical protein